MRILLVTPGLGIGGAERVVVDLTRELSARGHAVCVAGPGGVLELEVAGGCRVALPERGRSPAGAAEWALRLALVVRRMRPHVVHAHNAKATAAAALGARLGRGPRRPPVLTTHHGAARADAAGAARLLSAADAVTAVSDELVAELAGHGVRAELVYSGIARGPELNGAWRRALDAELGLGGAPVVAAVGRLVDVKDHFRFLDVAARVRELRPDARFLLVGDGPLRAGLEARAGALGIADAVRFTGARPDARSLIARADVLVFTSRSEGLSIAALEALERGVPVVSTPLPGMRALLGSGAGVLVEPAGLAGAVAELLAAPERRAAMGAAGAALVARRFSVAVMTDAYEARYRSLAAARRARPYHPLVQ